MSDPAEFSRPAEGEAPFGIDEVFFSRTDPRGVIQSGNAVFRRVADFDWSEMIGAPHRIIRHPDMPKGVFQLFWDRLKAGQLVGAYVKNKARDGLHYWVFALASPIEGGYLSVRIKPACEYFALIEGVYADLLARETKDGLSPEASKEALLAQISELGFETYDAFMATALSRELDLRDETLARGVPLWRTHLEQLAKQSKELAAESDALTRQFEAIRAVPINLGIAAVSLGDAGRPITVIAENYAIMCREVFGKLSTLKTDGSGGVTAILNAAVNAQILNGTALLQDEAETDFAEEAAESPVDRDEEVAMLRDQTSSMRLQAIDSLRGVCTEVKALGVTFAELERLVAGLDVTRILCRVEGGRLPPSQASTLIGIIDSLDSFHTGLSERLEKLDQLTDRMSATAAQLGAPDRRVVRRTAA